MAQKTKSQAGNREDQPFWMDFLKTILKGFVAGLCAVFLFKYILMLNYIPSGSMEDTIQIGDFVVGNRLDKNISRYDIVVFKPTASTLEFAGQEEKEHGKEIYWIKRVIGLPGEHIEITEGVVYADGVELDSSFVKDALTPYLDGTWDVPEGCYFVLGDNREHSDDSRLWPDPFLPGENIVSVALCTILPPWHWKIFN